MLKGIDHIVIGVADLERAIADFSGLGFTVVRGGRHPGIGTHNALIAFADGAYFELLAFTAETSPHPWFAAIAKGGGLIDFCAQTDDLGTDAASLKRAGVQIGDPFPMERVRPDGYTVKWVLAVTQAPSAGAVPFLIKDTTPRDERVPRQRSHPNGATGVSSLTIAVANVTQVQRWYQDAFGISAEQSERGNIGGEGVRFSIGPHRIEILSPASASSPLREKLNRHGASPFEVSVAGAKTHWPLDLQRAHGARLSFA
ncbi:MAG: VOC family protein [Candidatus Binataceae bacterium]